MLILFKSDHCPHCVNFQNTWDKLKKIYKTTTIDTSSLTSMNDAKVNYYNTWRTFSQKGGIPTLYYVNGDDFVEITISHDVEQMKSVINSQLSDSDTTHVKYGGKMTEKEFGVQIELELYIDENTELRRVNKYNEEQLLRLRESNYKVEQENLLLKEKLHIFIVNERYKRLSEHSNNLY